MMLYFSQVNNIQSLARSEINSFLRINPKILKVAALASFIFAYLAQAPFWFAIGTAATLSAYFVDATIIPSATLKFDFKPTTEVEQSARALIQSEVIRKILNKNPYVPTKITVKTEEIILGDSCILKLKELPTTVQKANKLLEVAGNLPSISFKIEREIVSREQPCLPGRFEKVFFEEVGGNLGALVLSFLKVDEIAKFREVRKSVRELLNGGSNRLNAKAKQALLEQFRSSIQSKTQISFQKDILPFQQSLRKLTGIELTILNCLKYCKSENVTDLDLSNSNINDEQLDKITKLFSDLKTINLKKCHQITDAGLAQLTNCTSINLSDCYQITDAGLAQLTNCTSINLSGCYQITDAGLAHLTNCTSINLSYCKLITDEGLAHLTNCTSINLSYCKLITDEGLAHLTNCTSVNLTYCNLITDEGLVHLTNCTSINLSHCNLITDEGLVHLTNCTSVDLTYCNLITDEGLAHLTNCTSVNLSDCYQITDAGLVHLTNCTSVNLSDCYQITDAGLEHFTNCTSVNLLRCKLITDAGLVHLTNCTSVYLSDSDQITDEGLKYLKNCMDLYLSKCNQITDAGLVHLANCTSIYLSDSDQITDEGLKYLKNCTDLYLRNCNSITGKILRHLKNCKCIYVYRCPNISIEMINSLREDGVQIIE